MAAGRPIKPTSSPSKRTPKVAGRNASRVTVSKRTEAAESEVVETPGRAGAVSGVERKRRAAVEREARAEEARSVAAEGSPPRDTESTLRTAAIVGAFAVLLGGIAAVLAFHPGSGVTDNRAYVDQSETEKVLSQTKSAACSPFQYDYKNVDHWIDATRDQFTGEALKQFEDNVKVNKEVIKQAQASSECQVDQMGVESLDGDHASVIGTLIVSATRQGSVEQSVPHIRYDLKRIDGQWRINSVGGF